LIEVALTLDRGCVDTWSRLRWHPNRSSSDI